MSEFICRKCCREIGHLEWSWKNPRKNPNVCYKCGNDLSEIELTRKELSILYDISREDAFIDAMANLKSKDIIEFNLKFAQFEAQSMENFRAKRNQYLQEKQIKENAEVPQKHIEDNRPKCPKCGSTSITTGARGVSGFWGFIGASKTVNRCANCGNTWKPRG